MVRSSTTLTLSLSPTLWQVLINDKKFAWYPALPSPTPSNPSAKKKQSSPANLASKVTELPPATTPNDHSSRSSAKAAPYPNARSVESSGRLDGSTQSVCAVRQRQRIATNKTLPQVLVLVPSVSYLRFQSSAYDEHQIARRFIPIAPALPTVTEDVFVASKDDRVSDPRYQGQSSLPRVQRRTQVFSVDRLLNPCQCKSIWECQCKRTPGSSNQGRLDILVQVATSNHGPLVPSQSGDPPRPGPPAVRKSCCASKKKPVVVNDRDTGPVRGPDLPPLLLNSGRMNPPSHDAPRFTTPTSIPSIKSVVLLAGTGCSCGFECACPGCIEHRVPSPSTTTPGTSNLRPCSDGCAHCVDRLGGVALPESESVSQRPQFRGVIETFLSRAANLPPPPKNRSAGIDPTNIRVFPTELFSVDFGGMSDPSGGNGGRQENPRSAWGLVDVPRLECCGGACGCPDGRCRCGTSCAGCCVESDAPPDSSGPSTLAEPMNRRYTYTDT